MQEVVGSNPIGSIMYIIPAIDLRDGKCVRLIQGDYHRQINYKDDPVEQRDEFLAAGAEWLHIVDLDGAKIGKPVNTETIAAIAAAGKLKIEVGGGIRTEESISKLLALGIERVIIGTMAVSDFDWFSRITKKFTGRIALALDARGSGIATAGWTKERPTDLTDFAAQAAKLPIAAIIYTDITKDGMMAGPNLERTKSLVEAVNVPLIAAGGVTKTSDIENLAKVGVAGAIIGRAIYEGKIELAEAVKTAESL